MYRCTRSLLNRSAAAPACRRWMSAWPELAKDGNAPRKKVTIQRLNALKAQRKPITVLTAYDYPTALRSEHAGIDICLVGDSLAQVALGYDSTTRLTLDEMIHHTRAVSRAIKSPFLMVDMPFGSYHTGARDAVKNAIRLVREGGAESVKLEGGEEVVDVIQALSSMGIPAVGHIGLLPQRHIQSSGYRVQGKDAQTAHALVQTARSLQDAGAFSIVLEAVPHLLASYITQTLSIPTIGIGAGSGTSGQVLVHNDMLGVWSGHQAKFVRRFAEAGKAADEGAASYAKAVRDGSFPDNRTEAYEMDKNEWTKFLELEGLTEAPTSSPQNQ